MDKVCGYKDKDGKFHEGFYETQAADVNIDLRNAKTQFDQFFTEGQPERVWLTKDKLVYNSYQSIYNNTKMINERSLELVTNRPIEFRKRLDALCIAHKAYRDFSQPKVVKKDSWFDKWFK